MKYYVMRFYTQLSTTGVIEDKTATYVLDSETAALKQYYKFLAADIDDASKIYVLCCVIDSSGKMLARQRFDHPVELPEGEDQE